MALTPEIVGQQTNNYDDSWVFLAEQAGSQYVDQNGNLVNSPTIHEDCKNENYTDLKTQVPENKQ